MGKTVTEIRENQNQIANPMWITGERRMIENREMRAAEDAVQDDLTSETEMIEGIKGRRIDLETDGMRGHRIDAIANPKTEEMINHAIDGMKNQETEGMTDQGTDGMIDNGIEGTMEGETGEMTEVQIGEIGMIKKTHKTEQEINQKRITKPQEGMTGHGMVEETKIEEARTEEVGIKNLRTRAVGIRKQMKEGVRTGG